MEETYTRKDIHTEGTNIKRSYKRKTQDRMYARWKVHPLEYTYGGVCKRIVVRLQLDEAEKVCSKRRSDTGLRLLDLLTP